MYAAYSASSKSRHSGSNSSRSSGYCGAPTVDGSTDGPPPPSKRAKDKNKKKSKSSTNTITSTKCETVTPVERTTINNKDVIVENTPEALPSTTAAELPVANTNVENGGVEPGDSAIIKDIIEPTEPITNSELSPWAPARMDADGDPEENISPTTLDDDVELMKMPPEICDNKIPSQPEVKYLFALCLLYVILLCVYMVAQQQC